MPYTATEGDREAGVIPPGRIGGSCQSSDSRAHFHQHVE